MDWWQDVAEKLLGFSCKIYDAIRDVDGRLQRPLSADWLADASARKDEQVLIAAWNYVASADMPADVEVLQLLWLRCEYAQTWLKGLKGGVLRWQLPGKCTTDDAMLWCLTGLWSAAGFEAIHSSCEFLHPCMPEHNLN